MEAVNRKGGAGLSVKESYFVVSNPYPEDKDSEDLRILFAGHSQTKRGHQNGPKVFDYYLIHYILSGKGNFSCDGRTYELGKGDSFLIEPGKLVAYKADQDDPWHYRWIAIQGKRAAELLSNCGIDWQTPIVHFPATFGIGKRIESIQNTFKQRKAGGDIRTRGYLYIMMSEFEEAMKPDRPLETESLSGIERDVKQVVQQLTTQYAEPISIEALAEALGYNRAYFSKMFKKFIHVTPVTFLLNMRIGKARQLLRERPELTVEQIAYSVGFNDPLYFSKQFKRFYGQAPSEYKKSVEHLQKTK